MESFGKTLSSYIPSAPPIDKLVKPKAGLKFPVKKHFDLPSKWKETRVAGAIDKLCDEIAKTYGIPKKEAQEIATNDVAFHEILGYEEKYWTLRMLNELVPALHKIILKKSQLGWTANARDGMTALAIARDKIFGEKNRPAPRLEIGGKNVQINVGWKFNPYKKDKQADLPSK